MNIVNELIARDRVLGTLAREATECSEENKNMAALSCLFILIEQAVKFALDRTEGNFYQLLKTAKKRKLISGEGFSVLDRLRQIRNKLFHETHYAWFYEKIAFCTHLVKMRLGRRYLMIFQASVLKLY